MANPEHLGILQQGVEAWNEWREQNPHMWGLNLEGADLAGGRPFTRPLNSGGAIGWIDGGYVDSTLIGANLRGGNFRGVSLWGVNFYHADLTGADFTSCALLEANFSHSCLRGAKLVGASLDGALFDGTDLRDVDFTGAQLRDNVYGNTDLRGARGLETCKHLGPSALDFGTLKKSANLPHAFLRGCGVPEPLIQYLPSLLIHPIQFWSCFISYSTEDQDFAERLHTDLQNQGVRCWFAPHDVRAGRKLHEQIDQAIQIYDRLLLILSEHSMTSEWVKPEIAYARQKEFSEGRHVLFPIGLLPFSAIREWKCFDADSGKDSAREIREYFIPDFSNWKDDKSYQQAFYRLMRDLEAHETSSTC